MNEKSLYSTKETTLVLASLISLSTISTLPMLLAVFMTDPVKFTCLTLSGTRLNGTCPDNQVARCVQIEYDRSIWTSNLLMEMNLVCDRTEMKALPNYGWFVGMFLTAFTMQMPDLFGRWSTIFGCQAGLTLTVLLSAAVTSIEAYSVLRACHGFFVIMVYQAMYTYYIESLTQSQRSQRGSLSDILTGLVPCLYATVGYVARDWRVQIYIIGALNGACLVLLWWLPESKEWLNSQLQQGQRRRHGGTLQQIKTTLKSNKQQFAMIFNSGPILRVCLIMVRKFKI